MTATARKTSPAKPRALVPLLPYQARFVSSPARFVWRNWSRQTGKSFAMSLRRVRAALERKRNQILLSAGELQSAELMEKIRMHLSAMKVAFEFVGDQFFEGTSFRRLEVRLPNGIKIIGLPANPRTARGFTGDVALDEFAMHQDSDAIWAALFPIVTRGEGQLDVCSTPKGMKNRFYSLAQNASFDRETITIYDAVRDGLPVDVESIREALGDEELFRQEYLCEFIDEATAFLTHDEIRQVEDATITTEAPPTAASGGPLYLGVDVGRRRDLTVMWLWEQVGDVLWTRALLELRRETFRDQREALFSLLRLPGMARCCIDATGLGMQLAEEAVEAFGTYRIEPVTFTPAVKTDLAFGLRRRVEDRRVRIPASNAVHNSWHSVRKITTSAGHIRFDAERTEQGHADHFWAAALGVHAAGDGRATEPVLYVGDPVAAAGLRGSGL